MAFIYHVTTRQEWNVAKELGIYIAPSLKTEGFIHCSTLQQIRGVVERYYMGKKDLLKLVIDPQKLNSELKYELSPSVKEDFPHVYGPINLEAIVNIETIRTIG